MKYLASAANEVVRIENLLRAAGLPVGIKLSAAQRNKMFTAMQLDKKVSQGEVKFVLAEKIGKVVWGRPVSPALIDHVIAG
jgi:3-dehydroquinate synthetase